MKKVTLVLALACFGFYSNAQQSVAKAAPKKKMLCNPLVAGQPISKFITLGFENQFKSNYTNTERYGFPQVTRTNNVTALQNIRFNANKNVVMGPKTYMNLGVNYINSNFNLQNSPGNRVENMLANSTFHSVGITGNIFNPLSDKHFIITNFSVDVNGNNESFKKLTGRNVFVSATAIYGWKKAYKRMFGIGVSRTYRLGRVIHVPAILYNENFNKKWGIDAIFPARANFRYTPKAGSMITMGYELEGVQYRILSAANPVLNNSFLQRGEIRPKIGIEQKLSKYFWLSANVGYRIMGRFDHVNKYDGKTQVVTNDFGSAPFANIGIHVVKFNTTKKKTK
jgi:hypothetical protein